MASKMATSRLRQEYMRIHKSPVDHIRAEPLESNILEWHYVIEGTSDSAFAGGYYHGILRFPPEYPLKPPSILMYTPNGRFKTNRRLCLSMSDFHPESWNPMWSVSTILTGLFSFMLDTAPTLGSIETSAARKRALAAESLSYNCKNEIFRELFPDLVEVCEKQKEEAEKNGSLAATATSSAASHGQNLEAQERNLAAIVVIIAVAVGSVLLLYR
uniref:E2 ubiquitin-conjugating enzyme n=1 Tax=Phaeomonas parva TaxID=124430 RepID=A0A7S1TRE0_9STRA|mmetsp:Transcript_12474/g.37472  ORF Transcript_12474/g.37472 Transcript_12474/m.37472 type:complete len:215 (+) Transcript_12474:366-1010(+)